MKSKELKVGQKFKVIGYTDPECDTRVCLDNQDCDFIIVWGFTDPKLKNFWSMMGNQVEVELVD